ncbi:ski2-like helicase, partial [Candidatus Woesearchaeota archaeon CG08_land_8_20_14_0_20_43_7]
GIAFHHSGLVAQQRDLIENNFREGKVKIICCTPTLAAGVDLPAFRTILKDLKRFSGGWGMSWIPVLEYQQMAGRAGRPGKEDYGEAIAIAGSDGEFDEIYDRYVLGVPEDIQSKLAAEPVLRTYILSLVVSGIVRSIEQIFEFFSRTFWAHQFSDMQRLKQIIMKMLTLLKDYGFITIDGKIEDNSGFTSADEIDKTPDAKINATLLGKRVSQLYLDPLTANDIICGIRRTETRQPTDISFLQLVCFTLEMRPLLSVRAKEMEVIENKMTEHETRFLSEIPTMYDPDYEDFLRSFKTSLLLTDWIDETTEDNLLETYMARPGDLKAKIDNSIWLLYATSELSKLLSFHKIVPTIDKLRVRLKYGVKEELLPLLRLKGIGRVRSRKMFANGIKDIGDVKKVDVMSLVQLLGKGVAIDIKKQIGEDVSKIKVKENKRKGQICLLDFN